MKILKILFFTFFFLSSISVWFSWSYPIKEVSKPTVDCKFQPWSSHSSDCKIQLPRITDANYNSYKSNMDYRLIYSVLWWASYRWWWDVWYWWHWWIDIATAQWTPVYSIWDWVVEIAWYLNWWWNTIVIRHQFNWWNIRSVYAHLHSINVNRWQTVREWNLIWTVWTTWNSRWNHLHFQIDINQNNQHPWYYRNCPWTNTSIVNNWTCRDQMLTNTIDPIRFLETNWASLTIPQNERQQEQLIEEAKKQEQISIDEIIPRERIMLTEMELFLARYPMTTRSNIPANTMRVWENWTIDLFVTNRNRPFNWSLPMELEIEFDSSVISVSPTVLIAIQDWKRAINVRALKTWESRVIVRLWWKIIANHLIRVVDNNTVLEVNRWLLYNLWTNYIWGENRWLIVMQDRNNRNIVSVPYNWTYTIKANNNIRFCKANLNSRSQIWMINRINCNPSDLVREITFDYNDTLEWLFLFKIVPINWWNWIIELFQWNNKIWQSVPSSIRNPIDVNNNVTHYNSIINWLKRWIFTNSRQWNFSPNFNINEQDAAEWIKRTFPNSKKYDWSRFKQLTRMEFLKLLNEMTNLSSSNNNRIYRDVIEGERKYANILIDLNIKLDEFSDRYFQPNKNITRAEVAHILNSFR